MALALLVQWDMYLRPSEVLGIRRCDVFFGRQPSDTSDVAVVVCPPPSAVGEEAKPSKTGVFDGTVIGNDAVSRGAGRGFIFRAFRCAARGVPARGHFFLLTLAFSPSLPR